MILSCDIETYGKVETFPLQTVFHPARSLHTDGVPESSLTLTCAVTLASLPSSLANSPFNPETFDGSALASMRPERTMVFRFDNPSDLRKLREWFLRADVLLGMNFGYDLLYLRRIPSFKYILDERLFLVDLSVLNYLESELRPERSLKSIGRVYGTHSYDEEIIGDYRFPSIDDPGLPDYNAQDSHNTLVDCAEAARRIAIAHPNSDKLSPYCLRHYSETIWLCVRMAQAGICFDTTKLQSIENQLLARVARCQSALSSSGYNFSGKGSEAVKDSFLSETIDEIDTYQSRNPETPNFSALSHPLLQFTDVKKKVCFSYENRVLLRTMLPPRSRKRTVIRIKDKEVTADKLLSTYTFPLLRHSRNPKSHRKTSIYESKIIPISPTHGIAYPSWYPVPTFVKDSSGSEGGTKQSRITCKGPHSQTDPPLIKSCYSSRFPGGTLLFFDLSQIELRVPAILSGEPSLISNYREGGDLHGARAITVFGPTVTSNPHYRSGDMTKDPRQWGKQFNFMDLFWASAKKMQRVILELSGRLFPLDFFQNIVDSRPVLRPVMYDWQRRLIATVKEEGILYLPFIGQSRHFEGGSKYDVSEILNCPVQTTASNTMLSIMHEVAKRLGPLSTPFPKALLFHNIYDAGALDIPHVEDVGLVRSIINESVHHVATSGYWAKIQDYYGNEVPLVCEIKEIRGTNNGKEK